MATIGTRLASPETGWARYNDTDPHIVYVNSTLATDISEDYQANRTSIAMGGSASITFYGTQIRLLATRWNTAASDHKVTVDGGTAETFSTYTAATTDINSVRTVLVWEKTGLPLDYHTVVFTPGSSAFTVDAIDVDSTAILVTTQGSKLTAPETGWQRYNDTTPSITYTGTWSTGSNTSYYGGTQYGSQASGSAATFKFKGTKLRIISSRYNDNASSIPIVIDGVSYTYDQYENITTIKTQIVLFEKLDLADGVHTVTITNPAGSKWISLDAVDIDDTGYLIGVVSKPYTAAETGWQRYDDTAPNIVYTGTWTKSSTSGCYNSTESYTNKSGDTIKFSFVGTRLRIIGNKYDGNVNTPITVDGVAYTYSASNATLIRQALLFELTDLQYGKHDVVLTSPGTTYLELDAIDIDSSGKLVPIIGSQLSTPETGWKRYEETNQLLTYTGTWTNASTTGSSGGTNLFSSAVGDSVKFTGLITRLRIIGAVSPNRPDGMHAEVYVDGVNLGQYNSYAATSAGGILVFEYDFGYQAKRSVEIRNIVGVYVNIDAIDMATADRLIDPNEVFDVSQLKVGKKIRCNYVAATSGKVGAFNYMGAETGSLIPVASSATPSGDFYWICVDYDRNGGPILIADRNIQSTITWDTLNAAGWVFGSPITLTPAISGCTPIIRLPRGTVAGETTDEWDIYVVSSTLDGTITPGADSTWHWSGVYSWTSTGIATNTSRSVRGNTLVTTASSLATTATGGFRPVITLQFGIGGGAKHLIQDGTDIKKYDANGWTTVGQAPVTESMFTANGMTDLSVITDATLALLSSTTPQILTYKATVPYETLRAIPKPKLVLASGDITMSAWASVTAGTVTTSLVNTGVVGLITSVDGGKTWKAWNGTAWVTVDVTSLSAVKAAAMTPAVFNAITAAQWKTLLGDTPATIRFGYYLEQADTLSNAATDLLTLTVTMTGEWGSGTLSTDFSYYYADNETLTVKVFTNGDFKVNY